MTTRRILFAISVCAVLLPVTSAFAQQTPLPGTAVPKFVQPLPRLSVQPGGTIRTIIAGTKEIQLSMCEFKSEILPPGTLKPWKQPQTWTWGYIPGGVCPSQPQDTYLGPVIVATRNVPTRIRFTNKLGTETSTKVLAYKNSTDQSLHWADPDDLMCEMDNMMGMPPSDPRCREHYSGAIPTVPHLHGAEVPAVIDGGPDQWFTSNGGKKGSSYYTMVDYLNPAKGNEAIYRYPNSQEAAPLWFHDHTLGATRLNVYAGLAGAYILQDPDQALPRNLPGPAETIPLVLQDRMFDTEGQLYFPAGPGVALNPEHPFWSPEFIGDVAVVNGKAWPYLDVLPRRYRFLFINGSNARGYEMFVASGNDAVSVPIWQIGTDGGFLDSPVKIEPKAKTGMTKLLLMPGERAEVIIDFGSLPPGSRLYLKNIANAPYPDGDPPTGGMDKLLQFRVGFLPFLPDWSYNPARDGDLRRTAKNKIVRLTNPTTGAPVVSPSKKRQLTLNEVMGMGGVVGDVEYEGGPSEILVNNTKWSGESPRTYNDFMPVQLGTGMMSTIRYSEVPQEGTVEQWEIINLTADAHPIHLHLVQFQILNRQSFDVDGYSEAYEAAFGGEFKPGFGPPLDYRVANADGAVGGNPAVGTFLNSPAFPPRPNEAGWKDTAVMYPGQVTRIMVRYAPTDKRVNDLDQHYAFEPSALDRGYVWHCHIIDHEDNEMMRPVYVEPLAGAARKYLLGVDY